MENEMATLEKDGVTFTNLTVDELRREVLKLQTLAVAVGQCDYNSLPEPVRQAWREPRNYRDDELHWLREKYVTLVEVAARVVRHHDQGTLAGKKDSGCIEQLRLLITGSIK